MINEEEYLIKNMGKQLPFTVPDGYFDRLAAEVMARIPEAPAEKKPARVAVMKRLRPWLYAAACICVGVFIAALAFTSKHGDTITQQQMASVEQNTTNSFVNDSYIDEEADYAMIDNQEIYAYLLAEM